LQRRLALRDEMDVDADARQRALEPRDLVICFLDDVWDRVSKPFGLVSYRVRK
jgi:hypothetical protein